MSQGPKFAGKFCLQWYKNINLADHSIVVSILILFLTIFFRIHPANVTRRCDHIGPQRVEDVRNKFNNKIQTHVIQSRNRVLAERDQERRSRIRVGEDPDEMSPLLGTGSIEDEDAISYDSLTSHNLPLSVIFKKLLQTFLYLNGL